MLYFPIDFGELSLGGLINSETTKSTVDLKFEVGDIEFHEIFIVEKLSRLIIELMFLQKTHTVLDMH